MQNERLDGWTRTEATIEEHIRYTITRAPVWRVRLKPVDFLKAASGGQIAFKVEGADPDLEVCLINQDLFALVKRLAKSPREYLRGRRDDSNGGHATKERRTPELSALAR